jgi:hypothetical protein
VFGIASWWTQLSGALEAAKKLMHHQQSEPQALKRGGFSTFYGTNKFVPFPF